MTCTQASFLCNYKNKSRLIATLSTSLTSVGITCKKKSQADADFLISSTAVELAKGFDCPVIVIAKYIDLLVILIDRSCPELYIQHAHNSLYSIASIREALSSSISDNLIISPAITGCDTVSAMYKVCKRLH